MNILNRWKKSLITVSLIILIISPAALFCFTAYHGKQLASPHRRSLQTYHQSWLLHPEQHGIEIISTAQLDGQVPCLIVSPAAGTQLGERGQLIRKQISERGLTLLPHGQIHGNVVLLHGRNGRKEDLLPVAERFCAVGLRCIIPDLPAHGESPMETVHFGLTDWESQLPRRLLEECSFQYRFPAQPCSLWGISMGGSFATRACSLSDRENADQPGWQSLVIVSSFDQLENTLRASSHSDTLAKLTDYFCQQNGGPDTRQVHPARWAEGVITPVMVAHGTDDQLIPVKAGKRLFSNFQSTDKKWLEVPGGNHSNVLVTPMPLYAEMASWILSHGNSSPK